MAIITKHKDTTGAAAAALEVGELGVNTVDGTLSVGTAGGNVDLVSPGTTTLPTGTDTQTLRNDSGTWEATSDLVVDSSGNVGIGNTSPNVKLVVDGSTRVTTSFIAPGADSFTDPAFTWNGDTDTGMYRVAEDVIGFTTGATERMRIDSSGNVGIQDPSAFNNTDDRLNIDCGFSSSDNGITLFGSNVDGGGSLTFRDGTVTGEYAAVTAQRDGNSASNSFLAFKVSPAWQTTAATERMRIDSSGNVGIGTAAPTGKVDIVDASVSNLTVEGSSGDWVGLYSGGFSPIVHCLSGSSMRFGHSTDKNAGGFSEELTIDSSGFTRVTNSVASNDVVSGNSAESGASTIYAIKTLSQAQYNSIGTKQGNTLYIIV